MARLKPRWILAAALGAFLIYAYPGYLGWDSEASLLQARSGVYTDAHPPAVALLWRIAELFVQGPFLMLLIQAVTLLAGLYLIFAHVTIPRRAAIAAACVFLFPPVAGVTALIIKDALMAGFALLGLGLVLHDRRRSGIAFLFVASAMRWNALAATCVPMLVLVVYRTGWRRYAIAAAIWLGITIAGFEANALLTDRPMHLWYGTHAYMDIAGTLRYLDDPGDAALRETFRGIPLVKPDHLHDRIVRTYDAADYRQLTPVVDPTFPPTPDPTFDRPPDAAGRDAVLRAWQEIVLGHPLAYLKYRWDNYRNLIRLDTPRMFAHVYVWFVIVAVPESAGRMQHDAGPSKIQDELREASLWLSNTFVYYPYLYMLLALGLLVPCRRDPLACSLLLSGLGYQAAWFFLDPTGDFRYSQWMILTTAIAFALTVARRLRPS